MDLKGNRTVAEKTMKVVITRRVRLGAEHAKLKGAKDGVLAPHKDGKPVTVPAPLGRLLIAQKQAVEHRKSDDK